MTGLVLLGLSIGAIAFFLWLTRNATVLMTGRVRNGALEGVRGHAPKGLIREMTDVLRTRPVSDGRLRVYIRGGAPALEVSGDLTEAEVQRLRNVLGCWPLAKIRAAPKIR